jgi:hypothetical protein
MIIETPLPDQRQTINTSVSGEPSLSDTSLDNIREETMLRQRPAGYVPIKTIAGQVDLNQEPDDNVHTDRMIGKVLLVSALCDCRFERR